MYLQAYTLFLAREHAEDFMAHPVLARHIAEGRLWLVCDNFGPARIRRVTRPTGLRLCARICSCTDASPLPQHEQSARAPDDRPQLSMMLPARPYASPPLREQRRYVTWRSIAGKVQTCS